MHHVLTGHGDGYNSCDEKQTFPARRADRQRIPARLLAEKPLLIRQSFPKFNGLIDPQKLIALACTEDVQARMVTQRRGKFELRQAPFEPEDLDRLGKTKWTVLVQGVNHYLPEAAELLKHFAFIPHARLDDLMVSYAPKGGGVGPHFDSYDVFLLQGSGHRRWQISAQEDRSLIEGAPLRILREFRVRYFVQNQGVIAKELPSGAALFTFVGNYSG